MSLNGFVAVAAVLFYYIASSLDSSLLNYHVCWPWFSRSGCQPHLANCGVEGEELLAQFNAAWNSDVRRILQSYSRV